MDPAAVAPGVISVATLTWSAVNLLREIKANWESVPAAFLPLTNDDNNATTQLNVHAEKLLLWQKIWVEEGFEHFEDENSIWGRTGWERIRTVLEKVVADCKVIEKVLDATPHSKTSRQPDFGHRVLGLRLRWRFWTKKDEKFDSKGWQDAIDAMSRHIDVLCTLSDLYFRASHKSDLPIAMNQAPSEILQAILDLQPETRSLYEACAASGQTHYLGFTLMLGDSPSVWTPGARADVLKRMQYNLFTAAPDTESTFSKWVICPVHESSFSRPSASHPITPLPDLEAVQQLLKNDGCTLLKPHNSSICYTVEKSATSIPRDAVHTSLYQLFERQKDCVQLERLVAHHPQELQLLFTDKIRLAWKITEASFLLFGTPWVSHLQAQFLAQRESEDGSPDYWLQCGDYKFAKDGITKTSLEKQMFQLGVFLIELALEKQSIAMTEKMLSREDDELSQVQRLMGPQYREACQFCLSKGVLNSNDHQTSTAFESARDENQEEKDFRDDWSIVEKEDPATDDTGLILKQFHTEVFLRFLEMYNGIREKSEQNI